MPTLAGDRRQPQGDHRRLLRQPRHRRRQVRRLPADLVGGPARRSRPLPRRYGQPGSAAARRQTGPAGGRRRASVRLRARTVLLGVRRRPRAVLDGWAVRALRGHLEGAPPARDREPLHRRRDPGVRDRARVVLAAHGGQGVPTRQTEVDGVVEVHPHRQAAGTARRAARGHRRRDRPVLRPRRRADRGTRPATRGGTPSGRSRSACCS